MTHPDSRANRDPSAYLHLALRLANLFPAVLDFETGEIGPDLWDEVVGNPPGTTPPRLEAWEAAIHPDDRPARDASWADCLAGQAPLHLAAEFLTVDWCLLDCPPAEPPVRHHQCHRNSDCLYFS